VIQNRIQGYCKKPELLHLINWQILEANNDPKILNKSLITPLDWIAPIEYLQKNKFIKTKLHPDLVFVWIFHSINALIFDLFGNFKNNPKNKDAYIKMIIQGLEEALSSSDE